MYNRVVVPGHVVGDIASVVKRSRVTVVYDGIKPKRTSKETEMPSIADMQARVTDWADRKGWWTPQCMHESYAAVGPAQWCLNCGAVQGDTYPAMPHVEGGWVLPQSAIKRNVLELMMLFVTEIAEAAEEVRTNHAPSEIYYNTDAKADSGALAKPEGVPSELADTVIRMMDFAGHYGIDLETAIAEKMAYNETREYRHGGKSA